MADVVETVGYDVKKDFNLRVEDMDEEMVENRDKRMSAGQSKRIWE
jgi:hypothetical protein